MKILKIVLPILIVISLGLGIYGLTLHNNKVEEPKTEEKKEEKKEENQNKDDKEELEDEEYEESDEDDYESYDEENFDLEDNQYTLIDYHIKRCIKTNKCTYTMKAKKDSYKLELKNIKNTSNYHDFENYTFDLYINDKLITSYNEELIKDLYGIAFEPYDKYMVIEGISTAFTGVFSKIINSKGLVIEDASKYGEYPNIEIKGNYINLYTQMDWSETETILGEYCNPDDEEKKEIDFSEPHEIYYKNCTINNDKLILGEKTIVTIKDAIVEEAYINIDLCKNNLTKKCVCDLYDKKVEEENEE